MQYDSTERKTGYDDLLFEGSEVLNDITPLKSEGAVLDREHIKHIPQTIVNSSAALFGFAGMMGLGKTTQMKKLGDITCFVSPFASLKQANADAFDIVKTAKALSDDISFVNRHGVKYIVIDESHAVLEQVLYWNEVDERGFFRKLKLCIDHGVKIVLMDAYMTEKHLQDWANFIQVDNTELVNYPDKPQKRHVNVGTTSDHYVFLDILFQNINNETVSVVIADTVVECRRIAYMAEQLGYSTCIIKGRNDSDPVPHTYEALIDDIYSHKSDLVLCTSCCYEGISFDDTEDLKFTFNGVVVNYVNTTNQPARRGAQGIARVRNKDAVRVISYKLSPKYIDREYDSTKPNPWWVNERVTVEMLNAHKLRDGLVRQFPHYLQHEYFADTYLVDTPQFQFLATNSLLTKNHFSYPKQWLEQYLHENGYDTFDLNGYEPSSDIIELYDTATMAIKDEKAVEKSLIIDSNLHQVDLMQQHGICKSVEITRLYNSLHSDFKLEELLGKSKNAVAKWDTILKNYQAFKKTYRQYRGGRLKYENDKELVVAIILLVSSTGEKHQRSGKAMIRDIALKESDIYSTLYDYEFSNYWQEITLTDDEIEAGLTQSEKLKHLVHRKVVAKIKGVLQAHGFKWQKRKSNKNTNYTITSYFK